MSNDTIWDGPEAPDLRPLKDIVAENFALRQRVKELETELEDAESAWKNCRSYILGLNAKIEELEKATKDAERWRAVITEAAEGIAICKEGAYGTPWVAIGPNEAAQRIDAAMADPEDSKPR